MFMSGEYSFNYSYNCFDRAATWLDCLDSMMDERHRSTLRGFKRYREIRNLAQLRVGKTLLPAKN
jgi:hypothetical protein